MNHHQLCQRVRDIIGNLLNLTAQGQIGFEDTLFDGVYWLELFTHAQEEFSLRGIIPPSDLLKGARIPSPTAPEPPRGVRALETLGYDPSGYVIKYGARQWLLSSLEEGIFRISPASAYCDSNMNSARRDSELERTAFIPVVHDLPDELEQRKRIGTMQETVHTGSDYYLACFAKTYSYQLCDDFASDACLIVRDSPAFVERMLNAVHAVLPDYLERFDAVRYYDPFNLRSPALDLFIAKDFRYAYQRECRFVWVPARPVPILPVIHVRLGNLSDLCDLLSFETPIPHRDCDEKSAADS